jgi:hypothetical protein
MSLVALAVAVASFGPPELLRPHRLALDAAQASAQAGDFADARAIVDREAAGALPEARDLLLLHSRLLTRLQRLETSAAGFGQRYLPYVFGRPSERLPAAIADLQALAPTDDAVAALLSTPLVVSVQHDRRAVALLVRTALLEAGRRHGLPLRASRGKDRLDVALALDVVEAEGSILQGTNMRSYTTFVTATHERGARQPIDSGTVLQLLGINEARAVDSNLARLVDRTLAGLVDEWIRRSLLGELST